MSSGTCAYWSSVIPPRSRPVAPGQLSRGLREISCYNLDTARTVVSGITTVTVASLATTRALACSTAHFVISFFLASPAERGTIIVAQDSCTVQRRTLSYFVKWNLEKRCVTYKSDVIQFRTPC